MVGLIMELQGEWETQERIIMTTTGIGPLTSNGTGAHSIVQPVPSNLTSLKHLSSHKHLSYNYPLGQIASIRADVGLIQE